MLEGLGQPPYTQTPVATSLSVPLTPNEGLVLQCLQFWWYVVRKGRGGRLDSRTGLPHTTVSAQQASDWLLDRLGVQLALKSCQRALRQLVEKGVVERCQERKRWGNHSYTYAPGAALQPSAPSNQNAPKVQPPVQTDPLKRSVVSNQSIYSSELTTGLTAVTAREPKAVKSSTLSCEPAAQQPAPLALDTGTVPSGLQVAPQATQRPVVLATTSQVCQAAPEVSVSPEVKSPTPHDPRPTQGHSGPPLMRRLSSLNEVVARCLELAGLSAGVQPEPAHSPSRRTEDGCVSELVKVGGCIHKVVDPVTTAPLR